METVSKIFVAGHKGLVGSAIVHRLRDEGYKNLFLRPKTGLDLTNQAATQAFFERERPEYVFLAAAKVGGIYANSAYPAEFIYNNISIQSNVIHSSYLIGVKKLLFLGSSCIYPRLCPQPMKEEYLLTGELEPTNEPYAIAKITGIKMCQAYNRQYKTNFISVMPANLYGPNDNFDLNNSHVIPALIRKFHEAKVMAINTTLSSSHPQVTIWGTGNPCREFLYVDDLAEACLFLMNNYNDSNIINVGSGNGIKIKELALLIKDIVGFSGEIAWDESMPDGTPCKVLDISNIKRLGWRPKVSLENGIEMTYRWFCENATYF